MTNISKPFITFFIETMEMYLSVNKKINFTQMARFGSLLRCYLKTENKKAFGTPPEAFFVMTDGSLNPG